MKAVRHVGIVVCDLEKALKFYRDLLRLKIVKRMEESSEYIDIVSGLSEVKVTTVKMAAEDGNLIELLYYHYPESDEPSYHNINSIGVSHVAFTVANIDEEYRRLSKVGVKFTAQPQYSPDGYAKVTFCRDFDGNWLELVEVL